MISVQFFASLKDLTGAAFFQFPAASRLTVEDVYVSFRERFPELERYRSVLLIAVNEEYANWETPVESGDTVAFFPPVSGGAL